ncbi:FixH family protein [Pyrinomonas methylaliphatogenes]|uniref:YtkA n=1 Tax=Pyrinomonas methylaliphatogenes TaxID=454194 RepID=A0A0B6WUF5_9BACT|nr:FixH family protein [Pyrinomonas methylaliphatogenes]MBX5479520.1 FixH family protein [Pyrinomonas methylaliphatogenes]CDM64327.1 YtkA [Pyrinomonas methylaliphatogenes]
MRRSILATLICSIGAALLIACGSDADTGKVIKSAAAGNGLTVELSSASGALKHGEQQFYLIFKDSTGKTVDVGAVALNFYMPAMGTMPAMNDRATLTTTKRPGVYRGEVKLEMAGEWQAQITYEGPAGKGSLSFPVMAQ